MTAESIQTLDDTDPNLEGASMVSNCTEPAKILPAGERTAPKVHCYISAQTAGLDDGACLADCKFKMFDAKLIRK